MVYIVHKPVEQFIFWMPEEVVSVLTFCITVCIVYDFSNAFRQAMDLRALLIQAEQIREELEQRVLEKKRLLEATAAFARAAVADSIDGKKGQLEEKLEAEICQLKERQEQLKEHMIKKAENLLLHNPGSRFMTAAASAAEIRERIQKH